MSGWRDVWHLSSNWPMSDHTGDHTHQCPDHQLITHHRPHHSGRTNCANQARTGAVCGRFCENHLFGFFRCLSDSCKQIKSQILHRSKSVIYSQVFLLNCQVRIKITQVTVNMKRSCIWNGRKLIIKGCYKKWQKMGFCPPCVIIDFILNVQGESYGSSKEWMIDIFQRKCNQPTFQLDFTELIKKWKNHGAIKP